MKYLLGLFALIFIGILLAAALKPAHFHVERSLTMPSSAEKVFSLVNDFRLWQEWSPWEKLDPNMKRTFEGPPSGTGASYSWSGNEDVGSGRMTIVSSTPPSTIQIRLEFLKPWAATNDVNFTFLAEEAQTKVTWSMSGKVPYSTRIFTLFFNMDKLVGQDFEKGLAQLKARVEVP